MALRLSDRLKNFFFVSFDLSGFAHQRHPFICPFYIRFAHQSSVAEEHFMTAIAFKEAQYYMFALELVTVLSIHCPENSTIQVPT